ncbi:Bgt-2669 [Blumeria graminis f. sp. tritici]|uniref:Bgt-2669 n=2 Tax=Blumeria graminis f. sp. tritici TaxID=62690 RepID=A0A381L8Y3_BLUGR|nr:component of the TOM (translocase of outer membrane) complex [Blumeria graminis f. sp. tritici 96224]VCU40845.1 Bgt-2669 [Blumeria graminis f. sp. tritici]
MSSQKQLLDGTDVSELTYSALPSTWGRISSWASENKAVVYTVAGIAIVVTGAGVAYYLIDSESSRSSPKKHNKKEKRRKREDAKKTVDGTKESLESQPKAPVAEPTAELPEINEKTVENFSTEERKAIAARLKSAGNTAYGAKDYSKAIELYGQAILCKPDPIYYSNRAACYNALSEWEKVIDDTTNAINLNNEYVKALNRRAVAYEHLDKNSEALLDFTASCIIDGFQNESSANSVERLLKKVAETKGKLILANKHKQLPSPTFVTNYLQSFRARPAPVGLEESAEIPENSGKAYLQAGLRDMVKKTREGYQKAADSFDKALEIGDLGNHEAFAYNMRGTFRYLRGENLEALGDLTKSIELQPDLIQSYIKRANIFYHRAQLHFILGEYAEAAKDYQVSIDLDNDFIFSHIQLGVTQYKLGSIASSMATFQRCTKNFEQIPDVYNYYGELLLDQQKFQEAIEKFDTAIKMEERTKPEGINVLPLINKALALFQWNKDYVEAEKLFDPECDIAVATMAQLLLQQGKVTEALKHFERAAELARTEGEIINALSYAEATRTQVHVQEKYPQLASRLQGTDLNGGIYQT